jgi:methyl-accepting chemotaxis protein
MNEQQTVLSRISSWFRRGARGDGELPLEADAGNASGTMIEPRSTFLRPWARRDQAIQSLQEGFTTLTDLMATIRDNLERQSQRQDELLTYLAHLPEALRAIPESSRVHGETLRAIHQQLQQQNGQQEKLAEILDKMSHTGGEQRETLDEVRQRVEALRDADEQISSHMNSLGSALQNVSKNSATGAQVLEQMRDRIDDRDGQLERILHKQNTRFTTMLAIAIFLSIAALVAVSVIGYLLILKK